MRRVMFSGRPISVCIRTSFVALLTTVLCLATARAVLGQTTETWVGGTGNWSNSALWNPAVVPNGGLYDVYVDGGNPTNSVVSVDSSYTVGRLTIDAGDTVGINNAQTLTIAAGGFTGAGTLTVNGSLNLNATNNNTNLVINGAVALNGTGIVTLGSDANNRIYGANNTDRLTVASTMTIQGAGAIGLGDMSMTNSGTIDANVSTPLYLQPVTSGDFTNNANAIWEATAGGTLVFLAGTYNNNGTIQSVGTNGQMTPTASQVDFSGSTVLGGTITTSTGGLASVTADSSFSNITNSGTIGVNNSESMTVSGTITNNGNIQLNATNNDTNFVISGPVSLNGTGTLTLGNNAAANRVYAANGTDRLTVASTMTIQGGGSIGLGDMSLTNNGTIDANVSNALYLNPNSAGDFTNSSNGILEATAGGTLVFNGGSFNNSGTIQSVGAGSNVDFANGTSISGGTITNSGGGTVSVTGDTTFANVTNTGTIGVNNAITLYMNGTITNNGTLGINSTNNGTGLELLASESLTGTGTVTLSNKANNYIYSNNGSADYRLTVGASQTIQGAGNIGDGDISLTNGGTIDANVSTPLYLSPVSAGDFTNNNIFEATAGGTLYIYSGTFNNNATIQSVGTGSNVNFQGASVSGGTITTSTGGTASVVSNSTFTNVANTGTIGINNGVALYLSQAFTNNGTLQINSTNNGTELLIDNPLTISGTGFITLTDYLSNYIYANNGTDRLTLPVGQTVQGAGQLGNGNMSLTSSGVIDAIYSDNALNLAPNSAGDFTNNSGGIFEATGGGILHFQGNFINNGTIQSVGTNGAATPVPSQVQFYAASITGGTITTSGGGVANVLNNSTFTNVTNTGTIGINNGTVLYLNSAFTNNGDLNVNSTVNGTQLLITSPLSISGSGTITLSAAASNYIFATDGYDLLTVGANQIIQGQGQVGDDNMSLVNNGTIDANVNGGVLTIQPNAPGTSNSIAHPGYATNNGTWEASNGGILLLAGGGGTFTSTNTIEALDGSEVRLSGNPTISGTLTTTGTGFIHNTNTATLNGVTLNGTYDQDNNTTTYLSGTITNNGTINVNSTVNGTNLIITSPVSLLGTGTINLSATNSNYFYANDGHDLLTIGVDQTIQGQGQVGYDNMSLINNGTIDANDNGGQLIIQPNAPGSGNSPPGYATNNGTWEASNGGILVLAGGGGSFNSTGTLEALTGSEVRLSGNPTISGTLTTTGTGFIHNTNTATLNGVTLNGTYDQDNNTTTYLSGTITNNGTINVNSTVNGTNLIIVGPVSLLGTGAVDLSNTSNNYIYAQNGTDRLTIGASQTIQGAGNLGNGNVSVTNNGTVDANVSTALLVQPNAAGDFTNTSTGILEATAGGTLQLSSGTFNNSGTIQSVGTNGQSTPTPSSVTFNGSTVNGGIITTSSGGTATAQNNATFNNVTNNGTINVPNNNNVYLSGTITNNGTIQVSATANGTGLIINGATTIAGTGAVMLSANDSNRIYAANTTDTLTVGPSQTIEGQGNIGVGDMSLSNNGTVNANVNLATLIIQPNAPGSGNTPPGSATNNATGLWEASNGGALRLQGGNGSFTNNGTIQANNGSTVNMDANAVLTNNSGGTLSGGTYTAVSIASAAVVNLSGGNVTNNAATVTLNGALASIPVIDTISANQAAGTFNLLGGQSFTTLGALSNAGTVDVGPSSNLIILAGTSYTQTAGTTQIDGGLTTTLTGGGHFSGGVLKGSGTFNGNVTITGSTNVEPGDSPGTLTIAGTYSQASPSILDIELGSASSYDVLDVTGTASIGGMLDVLQYNGFVPTVNEMFDILHSGGLNGTTFNSTNSNPAGIAYTVAYTTTDAIITITHVPEPSMLGLLSLSAMGLLRRRKSRN